MLVVCLVFQEHLVLCSPVKSRELDFLILMGPFQLEIFYETTFF